MRLRSDSFVDIDDIPDATVEFNFSTAVANALMCVTDLMECCNAGDQNLPQSLGEWYHPNGSLVTFGGEGSAFRRNRGQSVVRLLRMNNPTERGRFRCELPDAQGGNQTNYVNICELSHSFTSPVI